MANASALIAADEYRYLSPVFSYDAKTGTVLDIINVALTNNPAIDGMQAVTVAAASLPASTALFNPTESTMDEEIKTRLLAVLSLPTLATDADIITALDKAKALLGNGDAATSILTVPADKNTEIAALSAQVGTRTFEVDPTLFAPIAVVAELRTQLAALSAGAVDDQVDKLIEQGVADSRIIGEPAKAWLTSMGKKDLAALSAYLESAQPIAALSGMQSGATAATLKAGGRVEDFVDNSFGADGAALVVVRKGCFKFANNGSVTMAHTLGNAYIVDDQTVAPDTGDGTRSLAGTIVEVDGDGVWVQID